MLRTLTGYFPKTFLEIYNFSKYYWKIDFYMKIGLYTYILIKLISAYQTIKEYNVLYNESRLICKLKYVDIIKVYLYQFW